MVGLWGVPATVAAAVMDSVGAVGGVGPQGYVVEVVNSSMGDVPRPHPQHPIRHRCGHPSLQVQLRRRAVQVHHHITQLPPRRPSKANRCVAATSSSHKRPRQQGNVPGVDVCKSLGMDLLAIHETHLTAVLMEKVHTTALARGAWLHHGRPIEAFAVGVCGRACGVGFIVDEAAVVEVELPKGGGHGDGCTLCSNCIRYGWHPQPGCHQGCCR